MRKWYRAGLDGMLSLAQRMDKAEVDIVEEAKRAGLEPEELGDLQKLFQKVEEEEEEPFYKQFLQALRNYYYYRDKHGWKR